MKLLTVLVLSAYMLTSIALVMAGLSRLAFGSRPALIRLQVFLCDVCFAVVWPLALLSKSGRRFIKQTMKEWK